MHSFPTRRSSDLFFVCIVTTVSPLRVSRQWTVWPFDWTLWPTFAGSDGRLPFRHRLLRRSEKLRILSQTGLYFLGSSAPGARRHPHFLMEQPAEILWLFKSQARGDFLDGKGGLSQQIPRTRQTHFQEVMVGTHSGMMLKGPPEPTIADV